MGVGKTGEARTGNNGGASLQGDGRRAGLFILVILGLSAGLGFLINTIVRDAVGSAIHQEASAAAQNWAGYFARKMKGLDRVLSTGSVDEQQLAFIREVAEVGNVFRFKLFDAAGRLVLVSDEVKSQPEQNVNLREHNPEAQSVLDKGETLVAVEEGEGKVNRPPLYAEAYVAVRDGEGNKLGVVELYVDVTGTQSVLNSILLRAGTLLAVIGAAAFGLPMLAFMLRNRQALAASRQMEADAKAHSVALQQLNTDLAALNGELAERMKQLGSANNELLRREKMSQLGRLTATVAHELRNPLSATRTSAFLLQRKLQGKGLGVEPIIERINGGVQRCDSIITQLLDFSRSGGISKVPAALDAWIERELPEAVEQLPSSVHVKVQLGCEGAEVPFDPDRLRRALINLMSNAAEAMVGKNGKPAEPPMQDPSISVTTAIRGGRAMIRVADNGPGMDAEVLARICEPLFTTKSFGTGLGVPAVENIVQQHGGSLDIQSAPGKGAQFTIWLPLEREKPAASAA